MAWMLIQVQNGAGCELHGPECDYFPTFQAERAYLIPKGSGGDDNGNVVLLCRKHHEQQEKQRPTRFLRNRAFGWANRYDNGGEDFAA